MDTPAQPLPSADAPLTLTRRRKIQMVLVCWFLLAVLFFGAGEIYARVKGYKPWAPVPADIRVTPGNRFFEKDPVLGYKQIPGQFVVTLKGVFNFRVTHLPNGYRITHPLDTYGGTNKRDEIWIFGCSYTHGWSLNDDETYSWLLQKRFPEYEVVNFGVEGYGTTHSLLQFREAIKHKRPKVAVLAYVNFHDERNTFLRGRRKAIKDWNRLGPLVQPFARLDSRGNLVYGMDAVEYREFPLMRYSAFSHYLELNYNGWEERYARSRNVSEALITQMAAEAKEHGVKFLVAGLEYNTPTRRMLKFLEEHGIRGIDASVDLGIKGNSNAPYDGHPSARANKVYADRLETVLRAEYLD